MKKLITYLFLLSLFILFQPLFADTDLSLASFAAPATQNSAQLPEDQAFQLMVTPQTQHLINLHWDIAPGYQLYRDRITVHTTSNSSAQIGSLELPPGITKQNAILGDYQVYEQQLDLQVPIISANKNYLQLIINYQGCHGELYCYPPVSKQIAIDLSQLPATNLNENINNASNPFFADKNLIWILISFFGFGFLLAFTPCVLPMIPIIASIIVNQHGKKQVLSSSSALKQDFLLSTFYVLSMSLTYAFAGLITAYLGNSLQAELQKPWLIISLTIIFVLLALSLFEIYQFQLPSFIRDRIHTFQHRNKSRGIFGAIIMGFLSSLILSPCITPPLVGALIYIATTGNMLIGASALFALGIGMGIPLLIIGTSLGKLLPKLGKWMHLVKVAFGILMLTLAIDLLSRIISPATTEVLWGFLIFGTGIYVGIIQYTSHLQKWLWKSVSILLLVFGLVLITDGIVILYKNDRATSLASSLPQDTLTFITVTNLQQLNKELQMAKLAGKPVLLDFYAKWCTYCLEMEHSTFADKQVEQALNNYLLIRVDVTANDDYAKALQKEYGVFGPPSIVFIDENGNELKSKQLFGEVNTKTLLKQLH